MKIFRSKKILISIVLLMVFALFGCGKQGASTGQTDNKLTGEIKIDGSSTVFPITEAIAEEFIKENPNVKIPVGVSGTGGGFKKFANKEIAISDASRPIKEEEAAKAKANGVEYTELKVAFDGVSVVVNKDNTWVKSLTVEELKKMWSPDSKVKTWKDVRPEWPNEPIKFYTPGTDSGTFDYFTEAICGKGGAMRSDVTPSEDDNVLVQGVAGDKNAIGFFGFAYYEENKDKLKLVPIDSGKGPVEPTFDTIRNNSYAPLSRPLFIYVNNAELQKPEIKEFIKFYISNAKDLVPQVGYVAVPDADYQADLAKIK